MGGDRYSIDYFARGTLTVGMVLLISGAILIVTGLLCAVAYEAESSGLIRHWFLFLLAGFVAVVPGVLFLFLSHRLRKL